MKPLIFGGSGAIGRAVAWDLAEDKAVESLGIVGRREEALIKIKNWIQSPKIKIHTLDILNREKTKRLMKEYDVAIVALPNRKTSYSLLRCAVEEGLDLIDILEEYHRKPDEFEIEGLVLPDGMTLSEYGEWIHNKALENGVTVLDGMGFAPGLSNVTLGEGIRKLDEAETAVARVGGIPTKEAALKHPLRYVITWSFEHVLREYMVKLKVIKEGKVVEVDALSDREHFRFNKFGKDEKMVCAVTPGMPSFIHTRPQLKEFAEKTIRWPGHFEGIDAFKEAGLLDLGPVEFQGMKISPREFMLSLLTPKLRAKAGETDVCVMWNNLAGIKDGRKIRIDYFMWDEADTAHGISSMARVTGFSEAICARFLAAGEIKQKGIVPPEDAITGGLYAKFITALKERNIEILEEITPFPE
jgi:saccharopine dehydrogenase-like NADP-dependent oxidoreductase